MIGLRLNKFLLSRIPWLFFESSQYMPFSKDDMGGGGYLFIMLGFCSGFTFFFFFASLHQVELANLPREQNQASGRGAVVVSRALERSDVVI